MSSRTVNKAELAELLGCSIPTINAKVRNGMPYEQKPDASKKKQSWLFDTVKVIEWERQQAIKNKVGDTEKVADDELRRRKLAAETTVAEIEVAKKKGEVVLVEDVARIIAKDYLSMRAKLLTISERVAPLVVGETDEGFIKDQIDTEVNDALTALSNEYFSDEPEPLKKPVKTTTKNKRQRVGRPKKGNSARK